MAGDRPSVASNDNIAIIDPGDEIAFKLAERLLAGERGDLQFHLAILLEKSRILNSEDEMYRSILPDDLVHLTIANDVPSDRFERAAFLWNERLERG